MRLALLVAGLWGHLAWGLPPPARDGGAAVVATTKKSGSTRPCHTGCNLAKGTCTDRCSLLASEPRLEQQCVAGCTEAIRTCHQDCETNAGQCELAPPASP